MWQIVFSLKNKHPVNILELCLVFPACGNFGAPGPLSPSPPPPLISPKCRVLCVLFPGTPAGSRGAASQTWESEMRWLFILPAALWGPHTFLFFLPPPPSFSLLFPPSSFFFSFLSPPPSGAGAWPKTTPEAMYTNYTSGGGGCELDGWMEGWGGGMKEKDLRSREIQIAAG